MIHIHKTRSGKFQVTNLAKNGEVLKSSEVFNTKQACWDNIKAELTECYSYVNILLWIFVQDDTGKQRDVYRYYSSGVWSIVQSCKKEPKYLPGKNVKKKKSS